MGKVEKSAIKKWLDKQAEYYANHPNEAVYGHTITTLVKAVEEDFEHIWTIIYNSKIVEVQHRPNLPAPLSKDGE